MVVMAVNNIPSSQQRLIFVERKAGSRGTATALGSAQGSPLGPLRERFPGSTGPAAAAEA